jgi:ribosomal subunit interface protein
MKILIKGTNLELTEALRAYVEEKINGLGHYLEEIIEARVELGCSTHHQSGFFRCEVNLDVPQMHVLRAEDTQADLYAAIDGVIPKLKEQIETFKGKQRIKDRRLRRYFKTIFAWKPWQERKNQ